MRYFARKIGFYVVALWAAVTLNFFIPRMMPGNPVDILIAKLQQRGGTVDPSVRRSYEILLGADHSDSLVHQYFSYLGNLLHGDFGVSVSAGVDCGVLVESRGCRCRGRGWRTSGDGWEPE
jgi:peptide/nickel transport system permease protein